MATRALGRLGGILVVVAGALLAGAGGIGCAPKDNQVISNAADAHKTLAPAVINDSQINGYLQQIGNRIVASARKEDAAHKGPSEHFDSSQDNAWMFSNQIQFHLVNSQTLNAFTTGGVHVYIYNELLQKCASEDDLAAVMSHEFAHVYCRHVASGQKHQMQTLIAGAVVGGAAGYAAGGDDKTSAMTSGASYGAAAGQFVNMGFTRKDEAQADQYGFVFYTDAGWDPRKFGDFFKTMIAAGYDTTPGILSDHPTLASRVEAANQRVQQLGGSVDAHRQPNIATDAQFAQIRSRAAQLGKTLPTDASLANSQQLLQALPRSCVTPLDPPDAVRARQALAKKAGQ